MSGAVSGAVPGAVSGASSSQADQPEITVPTLVPGMVAATPNSGTQKELGSKSGRSPEALDWHSCDSSDSMEAAHLRVQKSQNSTPSDDLVDSRSPQGKGITVSLPLLAACHFGRLYTISCPALRVKLVYVLFHFFLGQCGHTEGFLR